MLTVADFKKQLSYKVSASDKEGMLLRNFLACFCQPDEWVNRDLLQNFYKKALLIPYWQSRLPLLQQALLSHLSAAGNGAGGDLPDGDMENLCQAPHWQLVKIQQTRDLIPIVEKHLRQHLSTNDKIKVLSPRPERVVAILLKFDGGIKVFCFGPVVRVQNGELHPLSALSELHYLSDLKLHPAYVQILEHKESVISFRVYPHYWKGTVYGGNILGPLDSFKVQKAREYSPLFIQLKQMEDLYIQPESDPHYQQLIKALHTHYREILINESCSMVETNRLLLEARRAIRHLYPHNRLLVLLTANIEFHVQKRQNRQKESAAPTVAAGGGSPPV